jgi:hypothetical protein
MIVSPVDGSVMSMNSMCDDGWYELGKGADVESTGADLYIR